MSDVEIVRSGLLDKLRKGDIILADKGLKDKSDFLMRDCQLIIPEFAKKGLPFTEEKNIHITRVSNARIHVEKVINCFREYRFLKGDFPLHQHDLIDHVLNVIGILVNPQGVLVTLK